MKRAVKFQASRLQACVVLNIGYHVANYGLIREFDAWRKAFACKAPDLYALGYCLAAVPYVYPVKDEDTYNAIREEYAVNRRNTNDAYDVHRHWPMASKYRLGYICALTGLQETDVLRKLHARGEWLQPTVVEAEFGRLPVLDEDANLWYNIKGRLTSGSAEFDGKTLDAITGRATRVWRERREYLNEMARKI